MAKRQRKPSKKPIKVAKAFEYKEKVLNYTAQTYQLTRPKKVGPVMELIRQCQPKTFDEWKEFYFANAYTKEKVPVKVDDNLIQEIGQRFYEKLKSVVMPEWTRAFEDITLEDCVEYIYEVTLSRTYDGFIREKSVVHDNLAKEFPDVVFEESDSDLDHAGDVDYIGKVGYRQFGLQIKPITAHFTIGGMKMSDRMKNSFDSFTAEFGGKVFIVFSEREEIKNKEVVDEIRKEIERLKTM